MRRSPLFLWLFGHPLAGASLANVSDHVKPWPVAKTADVFNETGSSRSLVGNIFPKKNPTQKGFTTPIKE